MTLRPKFEIMAPHLLNRRLSQTMVYLTVIWIICLAQSGTGAKLDYLPDLYKTDLSRADYFIRASDALSKTSRTKLKQIQSWKSEKREILKSRFGVDINASHNEIKRKPPQYLVDLYPKFRKEWDNFSVNVGGVDKYLGAVTTIRHHPHQETRLINNGSYQVLHFDLSSKMKEDEEDLMSELRLYRNSNDSIIDFGHSLFNFRSTENSSMHLFDISHIEDVASIDQIDSFKSQQYPLHTEQLQIKSHNNWISVDLKDILQNIKKGNSSLSRLSILVKHPTSKLHHLVRKKREAILNNQENTPLLLTYHRSKRSVDFSTVSDGSIQPIRRKRVRRSNQIRQYQNRLVSKNCQVRNLRVNFEEIGWPHIVIPATFNAKMCQGECGYPLGSIHNPTSHSIIQLMMHLSYPKGVPPPSCVPTVLKSDTFLLSDGPQNYVLQVFEDMVVQKCGCR